MSSEEGFVLGFGELARTRPHLTSSSKWVEEPELQERTFNRLGTFLKMQYLNITAALLLS